MIKPVWASFKIFLESDVSEEKFGVSVHGGHELRGCDDLTNLLDSIIERSILWVFETPQIPKSLSYLDAIVLGERVEV